jgi:triphosphatase
MVMSEQELKLHVPAAARKAVEQEVRQRDATRIHLHAMYFDTPDRQLARARVAIRLRQEGRSWVQTLKTPGANAITRVEMNHARPGPILDLSVYAGTEIEPILAGLKGELGLRYETDVIRLLRKVRTRHGTVEIAFDNGLLRAGALELPISELEFELMSGRPAAIFAVARGWQQRHGLVMDSRSKSERGDALALLGLALGQPKLQDDEGAQAMAIGRFWAPRMAKGISLAPDMTPAQALAAVAAECLEQITRNAAVLAEVDTQGAYAAGQPEHVHQLRVGMRRLRSAWRLFDGWAQLPPAPLQEAIRTHFAAFGANRDQDVLQESIIPALVKAGMPTFPMEAEAPAAGSEAIAASTAFQGWLLNMLEWSLDVQPLVNGAPAPAAAAPVSPADDETGVAPAPADPDQTEPAPVGTAQIVPTIIPLNKPQTPQDLRSMLARRLRKWHVKVAAQGAVFADLDIPSRHALRKRGKRLRYCLAFAESLLPNSKVRGYRSRLSAVQDVLGEINDLAVAHDLYRQWSSRHPQAWFALGWISARQEKLVAEAQRAFAKLARAQRFWK